MGPFGRVERRCGQLRHRLPRSRTRRRPARSGTCTDYRPRRARNVPSLAADRDRLRQDRPRGAQDAPRGFQHALACSKPQPCASRPAELGRLSGASRRSLPRRSRNPGPAQAVRLRRVGNDPSGAATAGLDWTSPGARSGRSPGQPTTHIPADLDRNRKGAPSPLAAMVRRSTKLATRSPRRDAGVIGRQARSARVGTRHSHAIPP
jgi:hypothetical protein